MHLGSVYKTKHAICLSDNGIHENALVTADFDTCQSSLGLLYIDKCKKWRSHVFGHVMSHNYIHKLIGEYMHSIYLSYNIET